MCLLAYAPNTVKPPFTDAEVRDIYNANPDGFGSIMPGGAITKSLPVDKDDALDKYHRVLAKANGGPLVLHWRLATHGTETLANCHPFEVRCGRGRSRDTIYLAHNGVLDCKGLGLKTGDGTDTAAYIRAYLEPVLTRYAAKEAIRALSSHLGQMIGAHIGHSKFALMDRAGDIAIVNESLGSMHNGTWISNTNWKPWTRDKWEGYQWFDDNKRWRSFKARALRLCSELAHCVDWETAEDLFYFDAIEMQDALSAYERDPTEEALESLLFVLNGGDLCDTRCS